MKGKEKHIIIRQSVIFCEHNYQKQMLRTSIFMGLCFYKMIRLCRSLSITFEHVYLITQKFHSLTLHLSLSLQKLWLLLLSWKCESSPFWWLLCSPAALFRCCKTPSWEGLDRREKEIVTWTVSKQGVALIKLQWWW